LAGCTASFFVSAYEPARADGLDWALRQLSVRRPPAPTGDSAEQCERHVEFLVGRAAVAKQARAKITFAPVLFMHFR
jgi:hypothetical protein